MLSCRSPGRHSRLLCGDAVEKVRSALICQLIVSQQIEMPDAKLLIFEIVFLEWRLEGIPSLSARN
jgi:hypothetical protein